MSAARTAATVVDTHRRVTAALIRELEPHFAGALTLDQVSACVQQVVADLHGSVCVEALPEMAARLARHRLQEQIHADQNTTTPQMPTLSETDRAP